MSIDPRANSAEKLAAPPPLPHVSRKALRRIESPLPPPTVCHYCEGPVRLVNNRDIYGREFGDWPFAYRCNDCRAYVGLHPDTDLPLGTLADGPTRKARNEEKQHFEALYRDHSGQAGSRKRRTAAYAWLAREMGLTKEQCHFGLFNIDRCREAGALCRRALLVHGGVPS